jgi:uncharacterized protein (DUF1501 family)
MLNIVQKSRRDFLQLGALGIGGLTLADVLGRPVQAGESKPSFVRDKSIVLLFLAGGPSQYETFDPKPDGFDSFTSVAGHIPTALPGVRFASYFPKLADRAKQLTIARTLIAKTANHAKAAKNMLTGGIEDPINSKEGGAVINPSLGSLLAQARGTSDRQSGMPTYAFVPPVFRKVDGLKISSVNPGVESGILGSGPGQLGAAFGPFDPTGTSEWKQLLTPQVSTQRLAGRRSLLKQFDGLRRQFDGPYRDLDEMQQQAYEVLLGGAIRKALDLSQEDPRVVAAYDTSHCAIYGWSKDNRWETEGPSTGFPLGEQMLLARRLCEAGSRFVTVVHSNWDMHGGESIWGIKAGMDLFAPPLDHAVAAFLDDVEQRGLSDDILLVVVGEFGRTPSINKAAGRDHNPNAGVILFGGGGLKHGQVIGETDRRGGRVEHDPVGVDDLTATLMHYLFDLGQLRISRDVSPALKRIAIDHGTPIASLFS